jgi:hypothetical protein
MGLLPEGKPISWADTQPTGMPQLQSRSMPRL